MVFTFNFYLMNLNNEQIQHILTEKFGDQLTGWDTQYNMLSFIAPSEMNLKLLQFLYDDETLKLVLTLFSPSDKITLLSSTTLYDFSKTSFFASITGAWIETLIALRANAPGFRVHHGRVD